LPLLAVEGVVRQHARVSRRQRSLACRGARAVLRLRVTGGGVTVATIGLEGRLV